MGNNTFKSLKGPLKDRVNIILSKTEEPGNRNGVIYYNNMKDIIENYPSFTVIGGETLYNMFLPIADEIVITTVSLDVEDNENLAYFPLETMEKEFFMVGESEMFSDTDTYTGVPINLIFTRWHRGIPSIH
jgi:dihydrofolate reductase